MQIGFIGLGKMGKNMVLRLLEHEVSVVAWNRSTEPTEELQKTAQSSRLTISSTVKELVESLETPRIIWLMLPAGEIIDTFLVQLKALLEKDDLIVDGANSFYKDTIRRAEELEPLGIRYMDVGVSGGPGGARNGACLMVGGARTDYERIFPLIKALASRDAYGYFGKVGAGHFTKMIHNGIEYGMMEAIAEGAAVLRASDFTLDLAEVFRVYNNKSVIESRLVGWTYEALAQDPDLSFVSSEIAASGEGEWTVKAAKELNVSVPVIEDALKVRLNSSKDREESADGFRNKVVSAQRGKFGGHNVKKS